MIYYKTMERLAIIDHDNHVVYFEDVTEDALAKYNGDEQAYIDDNYDIENYSWDYITGSYYIDCEDPDPREMNIKKSIE